MTRRIAVACVALLAVAVAVDAFLIEPDWIEVTHHSVTAPLASPLKIAHLTDIHASGLGRREQRMLALLDEERPDLIAVTGDSIFNGQLFGSFPRAQRPPQVAGSTLRPDLREKPYDDRYAGCLEVLRRLHAPLGVWFVRGNWEHFRRIRDEQRFGEVAKVHFLQNAAIQVSPGVWIIGLDDAVFGFPNLEAAFRGVPSAAYKIVLFHSPAYFEKVAGRCDLVLAGHTHGGQVYLPFLTWLWLPSGCGEFLAGWYGRDGSRMYVSRGIGTSTLNVRFLCRPELAIITVGG
jgi:predicted MPP superfamily phosphohydrolase